MKNWLLAIPIAAAVGLVSEGAIRFTLEPVSLAGREPTGPAEIVCNWVITAIYFKPISVTIALIVIIIFLLYQNRRQYRIIEDSKVAATSIIQQK